MTRLTKVSCLLIMALASCGVTWAQSPADETTVVELRTKTYVEAFNLRDGEACAQHWSKNGEYVSPESGKRIVGRQAIRESLQKLLETDEKFKLSFSDQRFRRVSQDVVIEEGTATLVSATHGVERARYIVVHAQQEGQWYRDSVRETTVATTAAASTHLGELEWLVGHWRGEDDEGSVDVYGKWINDMSFIQRWFKVSGKEGYQLNGTQIVGWDPSAGAFRSWSFDSEGGFEQAVWSRDGQRWLVKVNAVLPDGGIGSEQRVITRDGDERISTEVIEQQVNGQLLPGLEKATLIRQAAK